MHNHSHTHEHNCAESEGAHTHDDAHIREHRHEHVHCHNHADAHIHAHAHQSPSIVDKSFAILSYMLNHNKNHTEELLTLANAIEEKGDVEAARIIKNAIHDYTEGNEKLASALEILK